tara:strand:- start:3475 stop:3621 length:147 start_codon:yes stop_codon:yes gene_type:complete
MHVDLECGDCLALENEALKAEIERLKRWVDVLYSLRMPPEEPRSRHAR